MSGPGSRRPGARRDRTGRLLASLPGFAQEAIRLAFIAVRIARGPRSFLTYLRLKRISHHTGSSGIAVRMRLRPLEGHAVLLRPSTSDVDTVWGTFAGLYHRPPEEIDPTGLRLIWDLGSNIGLTMADLAHRHPQARVIGVELDPDNAALARMNTAPWAERCEVVEAAVWPEDGQLRYVRLPGATSGHYVTEAQLGEDPAVSVAHSISPASLLALSGPGSVVDYVKVDIEGAESHLLREGTAWAQRVRAIKVEVHGAYTVENCRSDLEQLGFEARLEPRQATCVTGVRRRWVSTA